VRSLAEHEQFAEALALLATRPADKNWAAAERNELHAAILEQRAASELRAGNSDAALADLEAALQLKPSDAWIRFRLAGRYAAMGEADKGRRLLEQGLAANPDSVDSRYALALYLSSMDELDAALTALDGIAPEHETTGMQDLRRSLKLRAARALMAHGQYAEAERALDALLSQYPKDRDVRIARADLDVALERWPAARDRYAALVAEDPADVDTRLSYTKALLETGDRKTARLQLERLLELAPNDARVLLQAGRMALADRQYAKALGYLTRAEAGDVPWVQPLARNLRTEIEARRQSWVSASAENRSKPGDAGISELRLQQFAGEWRYAPGYDGHFFAHTDAVRLDAGRLPHDFASAALLGTIQAAGPQAIATLRKTDGAQTGLALGVGYENDIWRVDIGTTPLGFTLQNVVGGVKWSPPLEKMDLAVSLARRAVTSSLLSYAGLHDPVTGRAWGGVLETGLSAQAGYYGPEWSLAGALKVSDLSGTQVLKNRFFGGRAASDWKFISRPHFRAFIGAGVNYWNYSQSLLNYTFGSGGYYSPQSYVSIALPVEIQGEGELWSYRVRAAISHSNSDTKDMPFYPDDPALQSAAGASTLPPGYSRPFFSGGKSSGNSLSFYASGEKQLTRGIVLGAAVDIDRSDFYKPTGFTLYVRHVFGNRESRRVTPPRPTKVYSSY
jgi:tetratricopeptide (TPR) repeat protein